MNTYQTVPNCLDMKEAVNDGPDKSAKLLQRHGTGFFSTSLWRGLSNMPDDYIAAFVEAAFSPIKYALFQYSGYSVVNTFDFAITAHLSSTSSLRVGAFGGMILTALYFALLLRRKNKFPASFGELSIMNCTVNLCKEIVYSALAAVIGVFGCGKRDELLVFIVAGALGPIVFTIGAMGLLGLAASIVWCVERFRDWYAGY